MQTSSQREKVTDEVYWRHSKVLWPVQKSERCKTRLLFEKEKNETNAETEKRQNDAENDVEDISQVQKTQADKQDLEGGGSWKTGQISMAPV